MAVGGGIEIPQIHPMTPHVTDLTGFGVVRRANPPVAYGGPVLAGGGLR
jgi:hypothetical protein